MSWSDFSVTRDFHKLYLFFSVLNSAITKLIASRTGMSGIGFVMVSVIAVKAHWPAVGVPVCSCPTAPVNVYKGELLAMLHFSLISDMWQ